MVNNAVFDKKMFKAFIIYSFGTLRKSPLEQYSIASKGRSFRAMGLNSSGTSLA